MQIWIRKAGPPFSLVEACSLTQVAELAGGSRYWNFAHSRSTVLSTSAEDELVLDSTLLVVGG